MIENKNSESWVLFQIFDVVLERWSPVYCAASSVACDLEVKEMVQKTAKRPVVCRLLGTMEDGNFSPIGEEKSYSSLEEFENENQRKVHSATTNV